MTIGLLKPSAASCGFWVATPRGWPTEPRSGSGTVIRYSQPPRKDRPSGLLAFRSPQPGGVIQNVASPSSDDPGCPSNRFTLTPGYNLPSALFPGSQVSVIRIAVYPDLGWTPKAGLGNPAHDSIVITIRVFLRAAKDGELLRRPGIRKTSNRVPGNRGGRGSGESGLRWITFAGKVCCCAWR